MVSVDDEYLLKEFSVSCRSLLQLSLMNRNSFMQSLALEKLPTPISASLIVLPSSSPMSYESSRSLLNESVKILLGFNFFGITPITPIYCTLSFWVAPAELICRQLSRFLNLEILLCEMAASP